jgi:Holliday junction resolvasome RuvABC endonuclease subunit
MIRLLALDQSISFCGYSVFSIENNQCKLLYFDTIKLNPKLDYFQRIISLEKILSQLVKEFKINLAIVEDIQKNKGTGLTTYKKLASLLFSLQYFFYYQAIDYQVIHVNTWRSGYKKVFGLSEVNKEIVYLHLYELLGQPCSFDNHMSDSIGMGIFYCSNVLQLRINIDNNNESNYNQYL